MVPTFVDLARLRPDARALNLVGIETALKLGVLPLQPAGAITPVASPSLAVFRQALPALEAALGPVACCKATSPEIQDHIAQMRSGVLGHRSALRTPVAFSSRTWSGRRTALVLAVLTVMLALVWATFPGALTILATAWATLTLVSVTGLRTAATLAEFRHANRAGQTWSSRRPLRNPGHPLPQVTLLVPLFREKDIAARLIDRLSRLDYPHDRLECLLILEADDQTTGDALRKVEFPAWMRVVRVPGGEIRTKPRAMNYALDFARGEIVGVYDAEDRPAPDQLLRIVQAFRRSGPDVACVQGILDFYNARQSWLTRCFTIDYATWFRLVLPGLARLGFVIPLGGTTVFFRREALERLGRWDAHNVTEDADLGLRLARHGFRTIMVPTVTEEEATASIPAWLRQRSRWIKGYAVTWAVHMRDPLRFWGELGTRRFLGVQILFLGTLSQFVLAPFLWSFWLVLFGLPHPITAIAPWGVIVTLATLFLLSEIATLGIAALSVATPRHRWLIKWVPMMHLYFPLAAVASWKGYAELIWKPFFWDKTAHGHSFIRRSAGRAWRLPRHPA